MERRTFLKLAPMAVAGLALPDAGAVDASQFIEGMTRAMGVDLARGPDSSVWLVIWNERTIEGIFPRSSDELRLEYPWMDYGRR